MAIKKLALHYKKIASNQFQLVWKLSNGSFGDPIGVTLPEKGDEQSDDQDVKECAVAHKFIKSWSRVPENKGKVALSSNGFVFKIGKDARQCLTDLNKFWNEKFMKENSRTKQKPVPIAGTMTPSEQIDAAKKWCALILSVVKKDIKNGSSGWRHRSTQDLVSEFHLSMAEAVRFPNIEISAKVAVRWLMATEAKVQLPSKG